jgi:hypothetical protein
VTSIPLFGSIVDVLHDIVLNIPPYFWKRISTIIMLQLDGHPIEYMTAISV